MSEWYFREKMPGETIREPVQGEFFATDAISDPGMALVREGIQNAMDAGVGGTVLVRIFVSGDEKAISASQATKLFGAAWDHYKAPGSGIRPDSLPNLNLPCRFIAFEDFQTCGLEGKPEDAFRLAEGGKNHFYHFFRAEGQSDKGEGNRGSWGVGKHVFIRSSQINTIFGLTIRADDKKLLLMGKTVLKSHAHGAEKECRFQDGYYGLPPSDGQQLVMPEVASQEIDDFQNLFGLQRGHEPGLSIVVPWPDPDITDRALILAVLRDYFWPILNGQLEVIVETPSVETVLDAKTILREVGRLDGHFSADLKSVVDLAIWAKSVDDQDRVVLQSPSSENSGIWSESLVSTPLLEKVRADYFAGNRIAVRVPMTVRPKSKDSLQSHFDIYMIRDSSDVSGRPTFIREGIIISKVDSPRTRGVRALVIVEDLPIAAFLRTAENPSHTEWQHVRLKDDYKQGYRRDLEFVKRGVHELLQMIIVKDVEEDPTLLADYFSIPSMPDDEDVVKTKVRKGQDKDGNTPPVVTPPLPSKPARFRINKLDGGFSILPSKEGVAPPEGLRISVAYDVRRGSPLRKYHSADFDLGKLPIQLLPPPKGIKVIDRSANRISVSIEDPDFALHLTGFDRRRQLYVRVTPREDVDDNPEN
jgi:hypothetical protein